MKKLSDISVDKTAKIFYNENKSIKALFLKNARNVFSFASAFFCYFSDPRGRYRKE